MSKNSPIAHANALRDWLEELKTKFGYKTQAEKAAIKAKEEQKKEYQLTGSQLNKIK